MSLAYLIFISVSMGMDYPNQFWLLFLETDALLNYWMLKLETEQAIWHKSQVLYLYVKF